MPAGTGMLFDLGIKQTIQVTTVPMLFNLDIAFFSEEFVVTEVCRNVAPGYLVTSTLPARYFLEGTPVSLKMSRPATRLPSSFRLLRSYRQLLTGCPP